MKIHHSQFTTHNSNVPALRFPEFSEAGEWVEKKLREIAPLQRGFDLPSDQLKVGNIPVVYSNGIQNFHNIGMAKAPGVVTGRSGTIGKIHFIEEGDYWPHNTSLWVTNFKSNFPKFIYYLYINTNIVRFVSGSGVPTLNRNDVHDFCTYLPSSIEEQQKIAACLSSLDELITAHSKKLDALKKHKKGLMQQLFPAEGQTVPTLRFPEFSEAGEWVEKPLEPFLQGYSKRVSANTELPIYSSTRLGLKSQKDYYDNRELENKGEYNIVPEGYFVYRHMSDDGYFKFNINKTGERIAVSREYPVFTTIGLDSDFLFYLLNYNNKFMEFAFAQKRGGTRTRLYLKVLSTWNALLPSLAEQQKIAACLSSLDELITAQSQKLAALKEHKKGLMQQLFVNYEL